MMNTNKVEQFKLFKNKIVRFLMMYKFALSELETRIEILQEEFQMLHEYNPIEHTKSRLKTPESILEKLHRKGGGDSFAAIRNKVRDIAGLRITCSFVSDIYRISEMLQSQSDLNIVQVKDYIRQPKPNGYQSLHLLVEVPVFMSDRREMVYVEVQIRTIAMDFWASLEHKIFYKYKDAVPARLLQELKDAADSATQLDRKMEQLHREVEAIKSDHQPDGSQPFVLPADGRQFVIPPALLALIEEADSEA